MANVNSMIIIIVVVVAVVIIIIVIDGTYGKLIILLFKGSSFSV